MSEIQHQRRTFLFILAGLAVLGVLAGLAIASDPNSAGLPAYNVTLTPNYLSPNDPASSNYQAAWIYAKSPSTPYVSPDSYAHQGRYLLLDPRQTDADGRPGRDDWWFVIQRYWPASYQPSAHGSWGREVNFHNVAGDAGPNGGVGWGFGTGVSSLALDWLPGASAPQFTVEPNHPNENILLPPVTRDTWHTYVVHFIAGRTDGSTVQPGALTVWADGNSQPVIALSNINTVQRAQGPDGNWYVQRWMQLWEGDYTQNLQSVSTVRMTLTRIGDTLQDALTDRPSIDSTSIAGQYYSGAGVNDGPPSVTQAGSLGAGDGAIPSVLGGEGQSPVAAGVTTAAPTTAPVTTTATFPTTTAPTTTAVTTTVRTTTAQTTTVRTTTAQTTTPKPTPTKTPTTKTAPVTPTTTTSNVATTPTPANPVTTAGPQVDATTTAGTATVVEWDGARFSDWTGLRRHLRSHGISGNSFLRSHPAIARSLAMPAVTWDGKLFYIRSSLAHWLQKRGGDYRIWAARHPEAVPQLTV